MKLITRLLSYITDLHIESAQSDFNGHLHVLLSKGRYQLCTDNAIYSFGDLYDNYSESFKKIPLKILNNAEILLLGFGLGSIPFMLEKKFSVRAYYTGVEIDPEVIRLASRYVLPDLQSRIELVESDAAIYLHWNDHKFDLIASDIFVDDKIPEHFLNTEYLKLLKAHLTSAGFVMLNMLYKTEADRQLADQFYHEKFKAVFIDAAFIRIRNNVMLVSQASVLYK
ncbi:MAG: fused MFS/spermidine synthase [Saprospiraceae bacterium]|nr:fused MFS/spermidine synthase [Saprospiraceae bacterium]